MENGAAGDRGKSRELVGTRSGNCDFCVGKLLKARFATHKKSAFSALWEGEPVKVPNILQVILPLSLGLIADRDRPEEAYCRDRQNTRRIHSTVAPVWGSPNLGVAMSNCNFCKGPGGIDCILKGVRRRLPVQACEKCITIINRKGGINANNPSRCAAVKKPHFAEENACHETNPV